MSPVTLKPRATPAAALTAKDAAAFVAEAPNRAEMVLRMARDLRKSAFIVGGTGLLVGTVLASAGAYMMTQAPRAEMQYGLIDSLVGRVYATVPAADAPRYFSDDTAKQYLRQFIENCDGYFRDNLKVMIDRCAVLMNEPMQRRYRDYVRASNPESPQVRYNALNASARPEGMTFWASPDNAKSATKTWSARYTRLVIQNGLPIAREPMILTVYFQWHPEMKMTAEAREMNTAGFQAVEFNFNRDPSR